MRRYLAPFLTFGDPLRKFMRLLPFHFHLGVMFDSHCLNNAAFLLSYTIFIFISNVNFISSFILHFHAFILVTSFLTYPFLRMISPFLGTLRICCSSASFWNPFSSIFVFTCVRSPAFLVCFVRFLRSRVLFRHGLVLFASF